MAYGTHRRVVTVRRGSALAEFEASGRVDPNRLRGLARAGRAAEAVGDRAKAQLYYERLIALTASADTERPEVKRARDFLGKS